MLRKRIKKIYIDYEKHFFMGSEDIKIDDSDYVANISKFIKENIDIKYSKIYFHLQNDEIIIRNLENIKTKRHKEIIQLIKYEINRYMPLDLEKYLIEYKKIEDYEGKKLIQAILFPRKFANVCQEISNKLKIKRKYLYINFDILQKMINKKLINFSSNKSEQTVLIENRREDMIINTIFDNNIIESYMLQKNINQNLIDFSEESTYYFGITDEYIKNLNIEKVNIKDKFKFYETKEEIDSKTKLLCDWGSII